MSSQQYNTGLVTMAAVLVQLDFLPKSLLESDRSVTKVKTMLEESTGSLDIMVLVLKHLKYSFKAALRFAAIPIIHMSAMTL